MGPTARKAMINIQEALGHSNLSDAEEHLKEAELLKNNKRVRCFNYNGSYYDAIKDLPGFSVEPYSVDHSAYDAYMFLIETDDESRESGKYVTLHTGDFRGHGRRGQKMITLIKSYVHKFGKRKVDALVIEGTMMSRPKEKVLTEPQMQYKAAKYLSKHRYVFLVCSSILLGTGECKAIFLISFLSVLFFKYIIDFFFKLFLKGIKLLLLFLYFILFIVPAMLF